MSTIAGLVSLNESPERVAESFDLVFHALAHRAGSPERWQNQQCALGARVPAGLCDGLEKSHSVHAPTGCAIVFDGRLDNREELLAQLPDLASVGATPVSPVDVLRASSAGSGAGAAPVAVAIASPAGSAAVISDAEIVLHAYLHWAEECAAKLLGDFAFAVWDPRTRSLYAARDPLGVRPFFFTVNSDRLGFASEFKALLSLPGVTRTPDDFMVSEFLLWWSAYPEVRSTLFRDITRLLPGHWFRWRPSGLESHRYWSADPGRRLRYADHQAYMRHFEEILGGAVSARLRGVSRLGIFLSGGMDSSSIAAMVARFAKTQRKVFAYTTQIPDPHDESHLAALVAERAGFTFRPCLVNIESFVDRFETHVCNQAIPLVDLGSFNEMTLLRTAAADGCAAIFTGDGGDELFNFPWAHVADIVRKFRVAKLFRELLFYSRYNSHSPWEMLWLSSRYVIPLPVMRAWKLFKWRQAPPWVNPEFARRTELTRRLRQVSPWLPFDSISANVDFHAMTRGRRVIVDENREFRVAPLGMHYSYPFYDRRLLEFMWAVPWDEKVTQGRVKSFLQEIPGLLPAEIAGLRQKADYGAFINSMRAAQDWKMLQPLFDSPPPRAAEYVNLPVARDICREFMRSRSDELLPVFGSLAALFLWFRKYA